jgi:hypothetical protein
MALMIGRSRRGRIDFTNDDRASDNDRPRKTVGEVVFG